MLICQRQSTLSGLKTKKENELKGRDQEPVNQESMLRVLTVQLSQNCKIIQQLSHTVFCCFAICPLDIKYVFFYLDEELKRDREENPVYDMSA